MKHSYMYIPVSGFRLVTTSERPIWTFPNDYIERLKTALMTANPNIFKENQGNP